jgi:hypothetical protein
MDANTNPIPKSGERNISCPFYGNCLDHAVRYCWESWGCSQCPHKLTRPPRTAYEYACNNPEPHYDLPADLSRLIVKRTFGSE